MKLQNEEVMLKNCKTLINEMNRPVHALVRNFSEKAFCNSNIEKVEILHVLHKVALLMKTRSEWRTRNYHQKKF